jgi:hypothetical protein
MKRYLLVLNLLLAVGTAIGGYYAPQSFWQPVLINAATAFFGAALAIILVNVYLERDSRRKAVGALLRLALDGIADFHNTFLDIVWTKFGKDDFGDLCEKYKKAGGDVMVLTPEQRKSIYDLAKQHQTRLGPLLEKVDQALAEVVSLSGWSLDASLLTQALQGRISIRNFRTLSLDDSDDAIKGSAEHLIDIDTFSATAIHILKDISE